MSKAFKETTWIEKWLPKIGMAAFAIIFTVMGFFYHPVCDIDRVYLSCRLHPFSVGDLIGCILFYAGCVTISGVLKPIYNPENSVASNLIWFVGMVLSIVLIWNL